MPVSKTFVYFIKIRPAIWSINKSIPVSKALRGGLGRGGKDLFFTVLPESFFDKISRFICLDYELVPFLL